MKISLNGTVQNIKVTSVILQANHDAPDELHRFLCPNDGEIIAQYKGGDIIFIIPGETPATLPTIGFCKKCKARYLFNSIL